MPRYRKPKPMTWATYVARRRIDVSKLLQRYAIKNYVGLIAWCEANSVLPPAREDVRHLWPKPRKKPVAKKKPVKKPELKKIETKNEEPTK